MIYATWGGGYPAVGRSLVRHTYRFATRHPGLK
nr:MAG TPA: NEUROTOXIN B-IV, TOXIN, HYDROXYLATION [Caudoviricetes sp.]